MGIGPLICSVFPLTLFVRGRDFPGEICGPELNHQAKRRVVGFIDSSWSAGRVFREACEFTRC